MLREFLCLSLIFASGVSGQIRVPLPTQPTSEPITSTPATTTGEKTIDVPSGNDWVDSGVDVRAGDQINFTASGTMNVGQGRSAGPQGMPRSFRDVLKAYPVNDAGQAALIGRIGNTDTAIPFLIGASKQYKTPRAGRLYLYINKAGNDAPDGTFNVTIAFATRGPEQTALSADLKLPVVTLEMIDRIPRRVTDAEGNAGDNTNFVVVGDEKRVIDAFLAAEWVKVDRDKKGAVISGILATLTKQAYLTLPMSELNLFGRVQDYGLAHAEPIQVVSQRNHLRLWKAPFTVEGQELWVGAATHDIGFDRDQRNNGVTHKIDPDIDLEREYVGRSLDETGMVAKISYILPSQPSKEAKTATGATFHSDGRVMVIHLMPESTTTASRQ
jgi:hypothetical protein